MPIRFLSSALAVSPGIIDATRAYLSRTATALRGKTRCTFDKVQRGRRARRRTLVGGLADMDYANCSAHPRIYRAADKERPRALQPSGNNSFRGLPYNGEAACVWRPLPPDAACRRRTPSSVRHFADGACGWAPGMRENRATRRAGERDMRWTINGSRRQNWHTETLLFNWRWRFRRLVSYSRSVCLASGKGAVYGIGRCCQPPSAWLAGLGQSRQTVFFFFFTRTRGTSSRLDDLARPPVGWNVVERERLGRGARNTQHATATIFLNTNRNRCHHQRQDIDRKEYARSPQSRGATRMGTDSACRSSSHN